MITCGCCVTRGQINVGSNPPMGGQQQYMLYVNPNIGDILYCYGNITMITKYINSQGRETQSGMNSYSVNFLYPSYENFLIGNGSLYPQYSVYTSEGKIFLEGAIIRNSYAGNPTLFKIIKISGSLIEVIRLQN